MGGSGSSMYRAGLNGQTWAVTGRWVYRWDLKSTGWGGVRGWAWATQAAGWGTLTTGSVLVGAEVHVGLREPWVGGVRMRREQRIQGASDFQQFHYTTNHNCGRWNLNRSAKRINEWMGEWNINGWITDPIPSSGAVFIVPHCSVHGFSHVRKQRGPRHGPSTC